MLDIIAQGAITMEAKASSRKTRRVVIRPKCITILYCNLTLFIDIFHFKVLFLCCFGLSYTVYNFPVLKQENQNSTVKTGHQVA